MIAQPERRNPFGLGNGPLARKQLRELTLGSARRARAIPFSAFSPERYAEPALALASDQYGALARGERSAIGLFARLAAALDTFAAPREFVLAATAAAHDEARHAQYCEEFAVRCGFDTGSAPAAPSPSEPEPESLIELDIAMLRSVALSETLAAELLMACRRLAREPVARALLTTLIADEVHHARLGWYYAASRAHCWSPEERQQVADALAEAVIRIESEFHWGRDAVEPFDRPTRALGVLSTPQQRSSIQDVVQNEILPGLDALGLNASKVWEIARKQVPGE
jgi:hypothetical protein